MCKYLGFESETKRLQANACERLEAIQGIDGHSTSSDRIAIVAIARSELPTSLN